MCGRFTQTFDADELLAYYDFFNLDQINVERSYNVAPSQNVLSFIKSDGRYKAGYMKWGLVPPWSSKGKSFQMINARAETLAEKPYFNRLVSRRRCVIVADSFYEWKKTEEGKVPIRFMLQSEKPFGFAGLWDRWENGNQSAVTCTIITTAPNDLVKDVHNRMPVILTKENEDTWLSNHSEVKDLIQLLTPLDENMMKAYEVGTVVNSPKNNSHLCIKPA